MTLASAARIATTLRPPSAARTVRRAGIALAAVLAACAQPPGPAEAQRQQSEQHAFRVVTVAEGLAHPWGMAFLPGGEILVTERPGRLRVIRNGVLEPQPVAGVPEVAARGQGGLLDVALHPDFASNRLVYLSFSKPGSNGATTAVVRGRFEGNRLSNVEEIFEANAWGSGGAHFGSRLVFDRDGYLYITVGDRGDQPNRGANQRAQNPRDHAGTTIRLHDDVRVPRDNPFVVRNDLLPEIYTYGNRNAQGMAIHPTTGEVWQNEHGPRGGDEINRIRAGANYGWPIVGEGVNYDGARITNRAEAPGIEPPLLTWTPSIAPSGMTFYTGDAFPQWRGNAFVGALAGQHLRRVVLDGTRVVGQEQLLANTGHRIRDVRTGPDGFIYLLVDAERAPVLRLEPAGAR
ncbi:PQQ-dependent sugar dehydrogenase [soil metagenome]